MRLEQLRYFLSIAHTQSINKTSLEFFTTHQGISKAIRQLEDELGAPLFTRSSKGMLLTDAGKLFLPVANNCVKELHRVQLEIQHLHRERELTGLLQIYGTPIADSIVLPDLLDDFRALYPNVHYKIDEANTIDALRQVALHKNALGLVVVLRDEMFKDIYEPYISQVRLYPLQQDEYVCLVGVKSPLAERKSISLEEFVSYPVTTLLPDANETHPLRQLLKRYGRDTLALSASTPRLIGQAVMSGGYIAISSRRGRTEVAYFNNEDVIAIPFEEDLTLNIMLATNSYPELDAVGEAFVSLIKERVEPDLQ